MARCSGNELQRSRSGEAAEGTYTVEEIAEKLACFNEAAAVKLRKAFARKSACNVLLSVLIRAGTNTRLSSTVLQLAHLCMFPIPLY